MKKTLLALVPSALLAAAAWADAPKMTISVEGIEDGKPIPTKFAYCMPDGKGRIQDGGNINPAVSWTDAPADTKSFALVIIDKDVPASFDLANQSGKIIPDDFLRRDFYHWVVVDIPPTVTNVPEGSSSKGIVLGGKPVGPASFGGIKGANDYSAVFGGIHGGYDGPCPPWNDVRLHHYHFIVFALNVATLNLKEGFTGEQAMVAIIQHTIASDELVGTYTNRDDKK